MSPAPTDTSIMEPSSSAETIAARGAESPIERVITPVKARFRRRAERNSPSATHAAAAAVTPMTPRKPNAERVALADALAGLHNLAELEQRLAADTLAALSPWWDYAQP